MYLINFWNDEHMLYAEEQPRSNFGPLSSGEEPSDPILVITSLVVLLVFLVVGFYVYRYFRNHRNK